MAKLTFERTYNLLENHEGKHLKVYYDTLRIPTVGIGHNLVADPAIDILGRRLNVGDVITEKQCQELFRRDLQKVIANLDRFLPWWDDNDDAVREYVLIDLVFNMGIGNASKGTGLLGFKNTLANFKARNFEAAARGLEASKWARQVKRRAPRICAMVRTGKFPDGKTE